MSDLEFVYFPIHARGVVAKMILNMGNVSYKDTLVQMNEFGAMKPS